MAQKKGFRQKNSKQRTVRTSASTGEAKSVPKAMGAPNKLRAKARLAAPRNEAQYSARPEKFKDTWDRVLSVISKMRTDKVSLAQASRDVGIGPRTVKRWGGSALRKGQGGRYVAKKSDTLLRLMIILTPEGPREITVRGSKQATLLAEYWNALHRYVETGDAARLNAFRGKHITDANGVDVSLLTDFPVLNRLASAGVLSFESLYARTT